MPDDRLSIDVEHADGRHTRWSFDEVDGKNIPNDLTFGTSIPGGYGQMSCSLLRRLDQDHPDQDLFDTVTVHGPGGRIAYQGRMQQFPRSHGDSYSITPGAVGWSSHLRDDPSFAEVYVDRDMSQWRAMPLAERLRLAGGNTNIGSFGPWETGNAGVSLALPNQATPDDSEHSVWYMMPPNRRCSILGYRGVEKGIVAGFDTRNVLNADTDEYGGGTVSALTNDDTDRVVAVDGRNLALTVRVSAGPVTPTVGAHVTYKTLVVYGNHGLTGHATDDFYDGFYASDVINNAVARAAPLLSRVGIETTSFAIPHLVYRDPATAEFVISDVNKYHLYDWGVYDDLEFFYRQPDPDRLCWEARLGDGAHMDADGLTGEQVINGVVVTYTDALGETKRGGPPGLMFNGALDWSDSALADTNEANPVNSHGIPAKLDNLTLSFLTTQAGATQIGTVYLAERSLATRRGSLRLTGLVQHPTEGKVPVWRVRAGDWIRVTDLNGENASVQRKVISTSYSHSQRQIVCELDNTPSKISAILERVGVLAGIQSGGGF